MFNYGHPLMHHQHNNQAKEEKNERHAITLSKCICRRVGAAEFRWMEFRAKGPWCGIVVIEVSGKNLVNSSSKSA